MFKVFVLDSCGAPLMPTHPARARRLLREGRAVVHKRVPFTIRLKHRRGGTMQPVRLKLDPGSRVTGVAISREEGGEATVLHLAEMHHKRGIRKALLKRRNHRRRRRCANLRYRSPRFHNRARPEGWLPPSLSARVHNVEAWVERYRRLAPVKFLSVETARFDAQKLRDPEISGAEYQRGELFGYEVREYLLEKWGRTCVYCGGRNVALQIEHVVPKSRGGSDRVGNLTLSCRPCNLAKGNRTAEEFGHSEIQRLADRAFPHAAAMNATRSAILRTLLAADLLVETGTGGMTKYNRSRLHIPKSHANDALCVGTSTPARLSGARGCSILVIRAVGRGQYRRTDTDASGFPRAYRMRRKAASGFRSGDLVRARTRRGRHEGTAVVRRSGYFDLRSGGRRVVQGVSSKCCELLQRFDGYAYELS